MARAQIDEGRPGAPEGARDGRDGNTMARSERRRRRWPFLVAALVALAAVGAGGWYFWIREDAPKRANIDDASQTLDSVADGEAVAPEDLVGEWSVDTSVGSFDDFSGTWAGYRFDEELASIGATTAVGRTPEVSGTMTVTGEEVTDVEIEVDLTTLQSDQSFRDEAIRTRGLESDEFPTGTFRLSEPLDMPDGVAEGERVQATATGDLTIHGVTQEVTVDLEAELIGDRAAVVGSSPVALADFGMEPPTGARVLSVADEGEFEFQVFFTKS
jgi:polyisoprenoid-binding protein YceI